MKSRVGKSSALRAAAGVLVVAGIGGVGWLVLAPDTDRAAAELAPGAPAAVSNRPVQTVGTGNERRTPEIVHEISTPAGQSVGPRPRALPPTASAGVPRPAVSSARTDRTGFEQRLEAERARLEELDDQLEGATPGALAAVAGHAFSANDMLAWNAAAERLIARGRAGDARVSEEIRIAIEDGSEGLGLALVQVLARIGDAGAIATLFEVSHGESPRSPALEIRAAEALANVGVDRPHEAGQATEAADAIVAHFPWATESTRVFEAAVDALVGIGAPGGIAFLLDALSGNRLRPARAEYVTRAFAKLRGDAAAEILADTLLTRRSALDAASDAAGSALAASSDPTVVDIAIRWAAGSRQADDRRRIEHWFEGVRDRDVLSVLADLDRLYAFEDETLMRALEQRARERLALVRER